MQLAPFMTPELPKKQISLLQKLLPCLYKKLEWISRFKSSRDLVNLLLSAFMDFHRYKNLPTKWLPGSLSLFSSILIFKLQYSLWLYYLPARFLVLIIMDFLIIWGCGYLLICFILDSRRQLWRKFLEEDSSAEDSESLSFLFPFQILFFLSFCQTWVMSPTLVS